MPNGPGYHRERPDITANAPGITANSPEYHRERPDITANAPTSPRTAPVREPRCFPRARPLPTANAPGITANAAEVSPSNSPSPRASVLSAGPGVSHREQRRFFPRAPVPASFY